MTWVVAVHSFGMLSNTVPLTNKNYLGEWTNSLYSQYILAGPHAVDTFIFITAFLNVHIYIKSWKNKPWLEQVKNVPLLYLHRYLRLTPAVAALFLTTISFWKHLGDGPTWILTVDQMSDQCSTYWWRFFFYIQNYYPLRDMCWQQTWYLSADMQLFILAPIALIPVAIYLEKNPKNVISGLGVLSLGCAGLVFSLPYIFDNYDNSYDAQSRIPEYVVGIIGGVLLHELKRKRAKINRILNVFLWILSVCALIFVICYEYDVNHHPSKLKSDLFSVLCKLIWALSILWIIISCTLGYGGIINNFLSNPFFEIGSRLTYCTYIVHLMVIVSSYTLVRTYQYFSNFQMYYNLCGHMFTSIVVGTFWHLAFEAPMLILDKMLFKWIDSLKSSKRVRENP